MAGSGREYYSLQMRNHLPRARCRMMISKATDTIQCRLLAASSLSNHNAPKVSQTSTITACPALLSAQASYQRVVDVDKLSLRCIYSGSNSYVVLQFLDFGRPFHESAHVPSAYRKAGESVPGLGKATSRKYTWRRDPRLH